MAQTPNKKIEVLHLITGLDPGGAERIVFDLCRKSSPDKFGVCVISLSKKAKLLDNFIQQGIPTHALKMNKTPGDLIKAISYLNNFILKKEIKIIHAHMTHALVVAALLKTINWNTKIVFTLHSTRASSKIRALLIFILKSFRSKDILFSKNLDKYYYKKNCAFIPNGIEPSFYNLSLPKFGVFTFIAVGRVESVKNHLLLVDAAEKLKGKFDFNIIIAGDGELRQGIESRINEKGLEDYVSLLGFKENIAVLLTRSHLFVMPSLWEGLPISLLEAGASRLPVLSTPVGNIPSLINEQTGYLSDFDHFADNMLFIYKHYDDAIIKASRLKGLIEEKYDINKVIFEHEKIYSSLVH